MKCVIVQSERITSHLAHILSPRFLEISIKDYKVERLVTLLLDVWNNNQKVFTAIDAAQLIGNILART